MCFICYLFIYCGVGGGTQHLGPTRQVLYLWAAHPFVLNFRSWLISGGKTRWVGHKQHFKKKKKNKMNVLWFYAWVYLFIYDVVSVHVGSTCEMYFLLELRSRLWKLPVWMMAAPMSVRDLQVWAVYHYFSSVLLILSPLISVLPSASAPLWPPVPCPLLFVVERRCRCLCLICLLSCQRNQFEEFLPFHC
jgi:hypothetical protein